MYKKIASYPSIEYTIIQRNSKIAPFVACYKYNDKNEEWQQGHYFDTLAQAFEYISKYHDECIVDIDEILHI